MADSRDRSRRSDYWGRGRGRYGGGGRRGSGRGRGSDSARVGGDAPRSGGGGDAPHHYEHKTIVTDEAIYTTWPATFNTFKPEVIELFDWAKGLGVKFRIKGRDVPGRRARNIVLSITGKDAQAGAVWEVYKALVQLAFKKGVDLSKIRAPTVHVEEQAAAPEELAPDRDPPAAQQDHPMAPAAAAASSSTSGPAAASSSAMDLEPADEDVVSIDWGNDDGPEVAETEPRPGGDAPAPETAGAASVGVGGDAPLVVQPPVEVVVLEDTAPTQELGVTVTSDALPVDALLGRAVAPSWLDLVVQADPAVSLPAVMLSELKTVALNTTQQTEVAVTAPNCRVSLVSTCFRRAYQLKVALPANLLQIWPFRNFVRFVLVLFDRAEAAELWPWLRWCLLQWLLKIFRW